MPDKPTYAELEQRVRGLEDEPRKRRQTEQALRESEERFRIMADGLPLIIWVHDADGRQEFVNRTFCDFFGMKAEDACGMEWEKLVHPSDKEGYLNKFLACVRDRREFHAETRVLRTDGEWRWIESWGRPRFSPSGEFLGFVGASADITGRKESEAKIRDLMENLEAKVRERSAEIEKANRELTKEMTGRKALSKRLVDILETDRRKLSASLHDSLGQNLVGIKMQLESFCGRVSGTDEELDRLLKEMKSRLAGMIEDVRETSRDLRPSVLDKLGLAPALRALKEKFEKAEDMKVDFYTRDCEHRFDPAVELALYRIAQESLSNIVKHARTHSVNMSLIKTGETLQLSIEDDGDGFDPDDPELMPQGILIMKERVRLCDGELIVESSAGRGTVVIARMPLG